MIAILAFTTIMEALPKLSQAQLSLLVSQAQMRLVPTGLITTLVYVETFYKVGSKNSFEWSCNSISRSYNPGYPFIRPFI